MSAWSSLTMNLWRIEIPQQAASDPAIRHITLALAARQERNFSATSDPSGLQSLEIKQYNAGLSALTRRPVGADVFTLLLASTLFIAFGSMSSVEEQNAADLIHLFMAIRILEEHPTKPGDSGEFIIENFLRPMLVRLELMYSLFNAPADAVEDYDDWHQPVRPELPAKLANTFEAQRIFHELCCWRFNPTFREEAWNWDARGFQELRQLFISWHRLLVSYQVTLGPEQVVEAQRVLLLLSQFQLMFVTVIFSARADIHEVVGVMRPRRVELIDAGRVAIIFDLPKRYTTMSGPENWEAIPFDDNLGIRLWPKTDVVARKDGSVRQKLTFGL
jgi:hypothetical protein